VTLINGDHAGESLPARAVADRSAGRGRDPRTSCRRSRDAVIEIRGRSPWVACGREEELTVDMKLEVLVVPVSDVDRAKHLLQEVKKRAPGR
jgi:hypothetical protein